MLSLKDMTRSRPRTNMPAVLASRLLLSGGRAKTVQDGRLSILLAVC